METKWIQLTGSLNNVEAQKQKIQIVQGERIGNTDKIK